MKTTTRPRKVCNSGVEQLTMRSSTETVSKRERVTILRQVRAIRASWSEAEKYERARLGIQRREELCRLLFA